MKRFFLVVTCIFVGLLGTSTRPATAEESCARSDKSKEPEAGTDEYVRHALSKNVSINVTDRPLNEVVKALANQAKVPVELHNRSLDNVGLDPGALPNVTANFHDLPLRSCLRVILLENELTYMVSEGELLITTPEHAEPNLVTAIFDVSDLLGVDEEESLDYADYDSLIELITTMMIPTSWDEAGPALFGFRGTLPIPQTEEVHDQIRELFAAIREAKKVTAKHGDSPPPITSISAMEPRNAVERIHKALRSRANFDFKDATLKDVAAHLQTKFKIPVRLHEAALDSIHLFPDSKVTLSARNVSLYHALRRLTDNETDLAYHIYEGVLYISSTYDADDHLSVRVYPVQDLVEPFPRDSQLWWGVGSNWSEEVFEYDSLMNLTTLNVAPTSWDEVGGPGSAHPLEAYGLIVVSQTEENHRQLEKLYEKLRKTIPAAAKKPIKKPADDELRLAVYSVPRTFPGYCYQGEQHEHINPSEQEVLGVITSIIEPESWRKRDDVYAHAIKDRLIIRHTNAVHRQIYQLARKLEIMGFREMGVSHGNSFFGCVVPVVGEKQLPTAVQNDPIRR